MIHLVAPGVVLVLSIAATAFAQTPLDLPVGVDGGQPQTLPFAVPSARVQSVYALLGPAPRIFTELGLRREGTLPNPGPWGGQDPGVARSFGELRIRLGRGDVTAFGNDLAKNAIGTPTDVFRQPVSLPAATDWPRHPMPWDSRYSFPFSQTYVHLGTHDLFLDLTVDQGTLTGGGAWVQVSAYWMDGWRLSNEAVAYADFFSQAGCQTVLQIGGRVTDVTGNPTAEAYLGAGIVPNLPVIAGFGLSGVRQPGQGVPVAASCQPLMMQPLAALALRTGANGRFDVYLYQGPHLPGVVGIPIFAQAAYTDPATGTFQLTNSTELVMPKAPDTTVRARTKFAVPATSNTPLPTIVPDTTALSVRLR